MDPAARSTSTSWSAHAARQLLLGTLILLLAACASGPHRRQPTFKTSHSALADLPPLAPSAASAGAANDILFRAIGLVGTPYRWGGNTPAGGFDCSGLVDYIYRTAARIKLPRTSHDMAAMDGRKVRQMTQLASGDLVFFDIDGAISHVGVYVGKGRFVHAPNSGGTVRLDDIDGPYWGGHFAYGKRVLD
ncbi:C40 family peptidase [Rhodanobacter panaciterrae]|uniref:C40 family peptidase n=1 Tax=Rhodanobacter panaciterrae TaxID=490572 RepID=UPI001674B17C|nr:C40 family peptidase [Rhodanobacter panaciterrae]